MAVSVQTKQDQWCLSDMVVDFIEGSFEKTFLPEDSSTVADVGDDGFTEVIGEICGIIAVNENAEFYRKLLLDHVAKAVEKASEFQTNGMFSRQKIVIFLREVEHNAAICETKWDSSGGISGGNYEFIDVVNGKIRYFIDPNFAAQFEIARPTIQYSELLRSLPRVFVGTGEELKKIVRIMSNAVKKSLNSTELSIPPWRKNNYMQKKWFGPYRRIVNPILDNLSMPDNSPVLGVKCRSIGFDVMINGRVFVR